MSTSDDGHWWPRLADHINTWWMNRRPTGPALRQALRIPPKPVTALILTIGAGLIAGVVMLLYWLVNGIVTIVLGVAGGIGNTTSASGQHLATSALTRTITGPVHTYLDQHTAGLPVSAHTLWQAWLWATSALFVLAVAGSRGARLGWIITGATTTAMVYAGTPGGGRALAAGLTLTAWAVLSVPAFNRLFPTSPPILLALHMPRRPTRNSTENRPTKRVAD
jgi:hypothetical protein